MTQSDLFQRLGAPLKNARWSWGSVRSDGTVFLRVWQDKWRTDDGTRYVQVTHQDNHADDPENRGNRERLEQVEMIRLGAPCYLVMCVALDEKAIPRKVKGFNENEVFAGGSLREFDGDLWIELGPRLRINEVPSRDHK